MQITSTHQIEEVPRAALAQIAQGWRGRAVIADCIGAERISSTIEMSPSAARAMARELETLCAFAARLDAQQVQLAAFRQRQEAMSRHRCAVLFAQMAAVCAGLIWVTWLGAAELI